MKTIIKALNEKLQILHTRIEIAKEQEQTNRTTIGKLFSAAKKDKEVVKQFKKIINHQGKQIIDLQKENDSLFSNSCSNEATILLQKEVLKLTNKNL